MDEKRKLGFRGIPVHSYGAKGALRVILGGGLGGCISNAGQGRHTLTIQPRVTRDTPQIISHCF